MARAEKLLNDRPRKSLGYRAPSEVFNKKTCGDLSLKRQAQYALASGSNSKFAPPLSLSCALLSLSKGLRGRTENASPGV